MNHNDLEELIDKIESDSMCRDEVFYDSGIGVTQRNTMFFQNIRKLQHHFDFYLEHEDDIMGRNEENEKGGEHPEFSNIVKSVNKHERQNGVSDE